MVEQPVAEQPDPVVGGRGVAVLLAQTGAARQGEQAGVVHAERGVAQLGLALGERRPRGGGGNGLDEAGGEPGVEADRAEAGGGEQRGELGEPERLRGEPVLLGRRRRGQPDELVEGREVPLLDHRRHRDAVADRPEQTVNERALLAGEALGWGRGEGQDVGAVDGLEQLGEQPPPHLQQVVALVEHEHQPVLRPNPLEEGDAVGVQPVDDRLHRVVVVRGLGVEDGEGLVGQAGEAAGQRLVVARVQPRRPRLGDPLGLDGGVGREHDRAGVGVLTDLGGNGLDADAGLARARRQHHPRPRGAGTSPRAREGLEGLALVDTQGRYDGRVRVGHRRRLLVGSGQSPGEPPCAAGVSVHGVTGQARRRRHRPRRTCAHSVLLVRPPR